MAERDNFSPKTRREIAERAAYICSFPNCGRMTVGPSNDRVSGVTMTGTAAHIVAAASGGQRADKSLTTEQRTAAENGIWMCAIHGKWIDDNPSIATVDVLHRWKSEHETEIAAWVEHGYPGIARSWDRLAALTRDQTSVIEASLPNGHAITRSHDALLATLADTGSCLVTGDSGVGKSALVKTALDEHFSATRQVWLGPEALHASLSEADRHTIGLSAPLADLLETAGASRNIIVFDAVERVDAITIQRLTKLIRRLTDEKLKDERRWYVILIGQLAGFEVHLDPLVNAFRGRSISIAPLDNTQVRAALESVPVLAAYASDSSLVAMLSNLKVLGWMIEAGPHFTEQSAGRFASVPQLADRLWARWTAGDPDLHSFMIALARRDAEYERSFALSDLSPAERAAWKAGRDRLPLALSSRNRLSFTHDLASDWARFHALKELQETSLHWSALAHQPLWVSAMRLFAQYLLRQPDTTADKWDSMFARAQAAGANDVIDLLLDGLCTDPAADQFLKPRSAVLFADNGKLLDRLLNRFMHIATEPARPAAVAFGESDDSLYAEAEMRSPTWRLWPPIVRFMVEQRTEIAALGSATVSKFCRYWLTKTPPRLDGGRVLGRVGIAELALETARVDQIQSIAYSYYHGNSDASAAMFEAALAGAQDNTEAVSAFAFEMARRRPLAAPVQAKVNAIRAAERARRKATERSSPRTRPPPPSLAALGYRKLPHWPLGPSGRLNNAFRTAVLRNNALRPLMAVDPEATSEVLLACIIDDTPQTQPGGFALEPRLGLELEHDDRPTLYWISPFFPFLTLNTEAALDALIRLVEFCTERWMDGHEEPTSERISLVLADGTLRDFFGDWQVLDWAHRRCANNGQLYAALDALERWLWGKFQTGDDIGSVCNNLIERTSSVAIIGIW